jgi:hypothetical protein
MSFVINSVSRPWRLAYSAADRPAEAPPMIMTSDCSNECGIEISIQRSHTIKIITLPDNTIQLQELVPWYYQYWSNMEDYKDIVSESDKY